MATSSDNSGNLSYQKLLEKINSLESRIDRLEQSGIVHPNEPVEEDDADFELFSFKFKGDEESGLESRIGEHGLGWLGNVVLFFGIAFFVQYLQEREFLFASTMLGILAVGGVFLLSYYLRNSNTIISRIFYLNGFLLLYYVTLKFYFFTTNPILSGKFIDIALLLAVNGLFLYMSIRKKNKLFTSIAFILTLVTAIVSDSTHFMLPLATLVSVISMILLFRLGWIRMVFLTIVLVYLTNLIWMFNNPVMGNPSGLVENYQAGFIYFFLAAAIFSLIALMPKNESLYSENTIISAILFNGLGFTFVCTLFIVSFFKDDYVLLTGSIALYCLVYSIVLQLRSDRKITSAFYALFGFVVLSVTIYGIYKFPQAYFLLAIQSFLVVSMAIWFRSKFIVIMNSLLFVVLLIVYLATSDTGNGMNISFSLVALLTARILNWKRERLTIRTEMIRNFYLFITFAMVLYTLYHLVPLEYVTLSWTGAAVFYFIFSFVLQNVKYRYLALATMIAAAFYLFIVDLAKIELVFRIIALFFFSVISIGLSLYYTRKLSKKSS